MADGGEFLEISAVWRNTSKAGKEFYSGSLGKTKIFLFPVDSDNPKAPAFRICLAARQEEEEGGYQRNNQQATPREQPRGKEPDHSRRDNGPNDDDIPF